MISNTLIWVSVLNKIKIANDNLNSNILWFISFDYHCLIVPSHNCMIFKIREEEKTIQVFFLLKEKQFKYWMPTQ